MKATLTIAAINQWLRALRNTVQEKMTLQGIIDASVTGSGANRVGDRIDLCKETIELHDTLDVASSV